MKLSIITINYNNREGLRKTLESVKIQTTREFEYIVIDGGSTDGSVDVIKEYADIIDYWVSEPDKGIYNAMNKGVAAAHGEYCQFLNSGDWLYDENVIDKFNKSPNKTDIILGHTAINTSKGTHTGIESDDNISFINFYRGSINHQSSFIKHTLITSIPYDEKYKICSDWKFFIESIIIYNCTFSTLNFTIAHFDLNGISNTSQELRLIENEAILKELNIPQRILQDYKNIDIDTLNIAKQLHCFSGFRRFICKFVSLMIFIYKKVSLK